MCSVERQTGWREGGGGGALGEHKKYHEFRDIPEKPRNAIIFSSEL